MLKGGELMKIQFDYASLGQRIRKARKEKGLTQEQLAELCDLSTAHIGHIERGTRALSIESLIVISEILNVSTDYLLMDISTSNIKNISHTLNALNNTKNEKYTKLHSIIKILIENVDNL